MCYIAGYCTIVPVKQRAVTLSVRAMEVCLELDAEDNNCILCFVGRASRYMHVMIFGLFRHYASTCFGLDN
jgi:hypothetical protein